ncbi:MAG: hypothetical protein Q9195_002034 [Heterodermia aff. obscurata]
MRSKPGILLTLDAFGTLFTPREPIAKQYGDAARRRGLRGFSNDDVGSSFRKCELGHIGAIVSTAVITSTFKSLTPDTLPKDMVPELLQRFSSSDGYVLYPDVLPFFKAIRIHPERASHSAGLMLGILTNSDDRVISILESFGLQVNPWRYGMKKVGMAHANPKICDDVDFVALSYDVGFEKPHRRIFDATREMADVLPFEVSHCIHVGDDLEKDYRGAEAAGWKGLLLDREKIHASERIERLGSLTQILRYLDVSSR